MSAYFLHETSIIALHKFSKLINNIVRECYTIILEEKIKSTVAYYICHSFYDLLHQMRYSLE